jgi:hypothetical protein
VSDDQIPGYPVDLVLCIDGTNSMTPIIEEVKARASTFHDDLAKEMDAKSKIIDTLRVRVIVFRDLAVDGAGAIEASDFFTFPDDAGKFTAFVSGITAYGGGDEPESGLEALALAVHSPWNTSGVKRRQLIAVWTDASAHPLDGTQKGGSVSIQAPIPADFNAITDLWQAQDGPMDASAQRLILYAPDAYPWTEISNHWVNVIHHPSRGGSGLSDVDYRTILDTISQSV